MPMAMQVVESNKRPSFPLIVLHGASDVRYLIIEEVDHGMIDLLWQQWSLSWTPGTENGDWPFLLCYCSQLVPHTIPLFTMKKAFKRPFCMRRLP